MAQTSEFYTKAKVDELLGAVDMANIVDSHGNKRFIEGTVPVENIAGITWTYHKWSLSGTHLMIVLAGNVVNGTTISNLQLFSSYRLPSYITNKIIGIQGGLVNLGTINIFSNDWSAISSIVRMSIYNDVLRIDKIGDYSATSDAAFRIQFDLLIDSE